MAPAALQEIKAKDGPNTYDAELIHMKVSEQSMDNIRKVAKDHQASIMTVILAAYAEAAAEALNQTGALASIVTGNRNHPALQDMVCSITTPVPVGMSLAGELANSHLSCSVMTARPAPNASMS